MAAGLEVSGEVFGSAASIVCARHLACQADRRADAGIPGIPERRLIRRTSHMNHPPGGEQSLAR